MFFGLDSVALPRLSLLLALNFCIICGDGTDGREPTQVACSGGGIDNRREKGTTLHLQAHSTV